MNGVSSVFGRAVWCLVHYFCSLIKIKMTEVPQILDAADGKATDSDESDAEKIPQINLGKGDGIGRTLPTSVESETYNMDHPERGICVIFNNEKFESCRNLSERKGTDVDAEALKNTFRSLGFKVMSYKDCTARMITKTLNKLSKKDHSKSDCFVCCMLTHGRDDILYCKQGVIAVHDVFRPFLANVCPTLVGKPKIFFFQACRGDRLDRGVPVVADTIDSSSEVFKLPSQADFVTCYGTTPGYLSWRNEGCGSWFIQALCKTLNEHAPQMDLLSMMTVVSRRVAYDFESYDSQNKDLCGMKQVPVIVSTLTRQISFHPKDNVPCNVSSSRDSSVSSGLSSGQPEQVEKCGKKVRKGCVLC